MNIQFRKYQLLQLIRSKSVPQNMKPPDVIFPNIKTNLVIKKIELENNVNLIIKKRDDMFLRSQYGGCLRPSKNTLVTNTDQGGF